MRLPFFILSFCFCVTVSSTAQQKRPPIWEARLQYELPADTINVKVVSNINYQKDKNDFTLLDIYLPKASTTNELLPVVFLIHGGPLSPGIPVKPKDWKVYQDYGKLIAANGMIAVAFNHRLFDKDNIFQSRNDILDAIEFVKANAPAYKINSNAIALWMFSLGGKHFDFFARQKDSSIKTMISFYGFLSQENNSLDSVKHTPAQLVIRCGNDKPELLKETDAFISKAIQLNFPVEIVNYNEGVHAFDIFQKSAETTRLINRALDFIKEKLFHKE